MSFTGFGDKEVLSKVKSYLETAGADTVELSPGFFRGFKCQISCGACCSAVSLDILKDSKRWNDFVELYPEESKKFTEVEQNEVLIMSYSNSDHKEKKCFFLDKSNGLCTVHEAAPLPCRIAPLKFIDKRVSRNKTYLNASAYGRAWAFTQIDGQTKGAMCSITDFNYEKTLQDIEMLKELREYGRVLQIPSKLKYIIEFLEDAVEILKDHSNTPLHLQMVSQQFTQENTY